MGVGSGPTMVAMVAILLLAGAQGLHVPTTRRAALAGSICVPFIALPASAVPNPAAQCDREDTECLTTRRAAATQNLKENWGGAVGVASLLVLRGWNRARVDAVNPDS